MDKTQDKLFDFLIGVSTRKNKKNACQ